MINSSINILYVTESQNAHIYNEGVRKDYIQQHTRDILATWMKSDIDFYYFVKQRMHNIANALQQRQLLYNTHPPTLNTWLSSNASAAKSDLLQRLGYNESCKPHEKYVHCLDAV